MAPDQKYSLWPALTIIVLALAAPITIGTFEMRVARNAHAETAAIEQLHAIAQAENDYRKANNGYSANLADLKDLPKPENFYKIGYRQLSPDMYIAMAWPYEPGKHGKRYFFMDQSGIVRYEVMHPAGPFSNEVPALAKR